MAKLNLTWDFMFVYFSSDKNLSKNQLSEFWLLEVQSKFGVVERNTMQGFFSYSLKIARKRNLNCFIKRQLLYSFFNEEKRQSSLFFSCPCYSRIVNKTLNHCIVEQVYIWSKKKIRIRQIIGTVIRLFISLL